MAALLRRILRWAAYVAATLVIVLALLVGVARLLLPLVPEYQDQIRRLAQDATGLTVDFERVSASWPLAGPEIRLFDVEVSIPEARQALLVAEQLTVGISLPRLIATREIVPGRVGISGASLALRRDLTGRLRIQNQALDELPLWSQSGANQELRRITLNLDAIEVTYADDARPATGIDFVVTDLELDFDRQFWHLDGELELGSDFGRRVDFAIDLPAELIVSRGAALTGRPEWQIAVTGEQLQLARLLGVWLAEPLPLVDGRGRVAVSSRFAGLDPVSLKVDLDLADVTVVADDAPEPYGALAGRFEWERQASGWLFAATGLRVARAGRAWPGSDWSVVFREASASRARQFDATVSFARLEDLYPLLQAVATEPVRNGLLPERVEGDLVDLTLKLQLPVAEPPAYELAAAFDRLGWTVQGDGPAVFGISGQFRADQDGGRLQIDSSAATLAVPELISDLVEIDQLAGFLVWRVTENQIRILSDSIDITSPAVELNSRFELNLPRNGDSAYLDMSAEARADDIAAAVDYLPLGRFPAGVARWLRRALVAGRLTRGQFELRGLLAEIPYDDVPGRFRIALEIEDALLDYADGWPPIEQLDGQFVIDGASLETTENSAVIGGIQVKDRAVRFADLRAGLLEATAAQTVGVEQLLGFLRASPVRDALGPTLDRVRGSGEVAGELRLELPVNRPGDYRLKARLQPRGSTLGLDNVDFEFTELAGVIEVRNTQISADGLAARLLNEPVEISLRPAVEPDGLYSHYAHVRGATPAPRWIETLGLPYPERFSGSLRWNAMAMIPARRETDTAALHIMVRSDLIGMESRLPVPLAKTAGAAAPLQVDIAFPRDGEIEVSGKLRDEISWALRLLGTDPGWQLERGAVRAGSADALLPTQPGVELSGRLARLDFADWLALSDGAASRRWSEIYREAIFDIDALNMFGQIFRSVELQADRGAARWRVDVESPAAVGRIEVPLELSGAEPLQFDMQRLWLEESVDDAPATIDPREVVPADVRVANFGIGEMRFGTLETVITRVPDGLMARPINMTADSFTLAGDGAWLVEADDVERQRSRLRLELDSRNIKPTLIGLGYDPLIEGDAASASLDVSWSGAPSANFLADATGEFEVRMKEGALLELEPGGGRLLGVLSVAALPRRLALDFSDVFDEGLNFDTLEGKFSLDGGNAYTCNLGLEGSVADMGIVGRTGLRDEDYDQIAVVRPHMSNVLALGGTVVGGPGVGAAMLLISQIFRKPLSTLGESYYRVSGSWQDPDIDRVQRSDVDATPFSDCEQYLARVLPELDEVVELTESPAPPLTDAGAR